MGKYTQIQIDIKHDNEDDANLILQNVSQFLVKEGFEIMGTDLVDVTESYNVGEEAFKNYIIEKQGYIISEATLRIEDLLGVSYQLLKEYGINKQLQHLISNCFNMEPTSENLYHLTCHIHNHMQQTADVIFNEEVFEYFNSIAPKGYHFSSSEDDGACFGWFKDEQEETLELRDLCDAGVSQEIHQIEKSNLKLSDKMVEIDFDGAIPDLVLPEMPYPDPPEQAPMINEPTYLESRDKIENIISKMIGCLSSEELLMFYSWWDSSPKADEYLMDTIGKKLEKEGL